MAATVLTIVDEEEAPEVARFLLDRTEREEMTTREKANLIDIVTSIMMYEFANLSQLEIRAMLGLNLTEEPRAIREAKEEGREEGQQEGREAEALSLVIRLLTRRLRQELSEEVRSRLATLSLSLLEELSEALLDFTNLSDLEHWLVEHR